jgi:hypothetical protein
MTDANRWTALNSGKTAALFGISASLPKVSNYGMLSPGAFAALGRPERVELLTDGTGAFAIRPTKNGGIRLTTLVDTGGTRFSCLRLKSAGVATGRFIGHEEDGMLVFEPGMTS